MHLISTQTCICDLKNHGEKSYHHVQPKIAIVTVIQIMYNVPYASTLYLKPGEQTTCRDPVSCRVRTLQSLLPFNKTVKLRAFYKSTKALYQRSFI